MLLELLLFEHADFVFGCVHAPVFDIDIEFRQVEIRSHGVAAENAIAFVVAVGDVVRAEPVGEHSLVVRLDEGPGLCGDGFVEFHLGVEVPAVQGDTVEAGVAEGALEGLLAAGVLVCSGEVAAA